MDGQIFLIIWTFDRNDHIIPWFKLRCYLRDWCVFCLTDLGKAITELFRWCDWVIAKVINEYNFRQGEKGQVTECMMNLHLYVFIIFVLFWHDSAFYLVINSYQHAWWLAHSWLPAIAHEFCENILDKC